MKQIVSTVRLMGSLKSFLKGAHKASAAAERDVIGCVERIEAGIASGWVLSRTHKPIRLSAVVSGEVYDLKSVSWQERKDVREAHSWGTLHAGFVAQLPGAVRSRLDGNAHDPLSFIANGEPMAILASARLRSNGAATDNDGLSRSRNLGMSRTAVIDPLSKTPPDWAHDIAMLGPVFFEVAELFDEASYRRRAVNDGQARLPDKLQLLRQYLTSAADPWTGPDPHPLFDVAHYSQQVPARDRELHPLVHYLTVGWKAGLRPHALFDPQFYAEQSAVPPGVPPLLHYLQEGWRSGLTPQRLFCPAYFVKTAELPTPQAEAPLVTYLRGDHHGDPHYLFDTEHYRRFQGFPHWDAIIMRYATFSTSNPLPKLADLGSVDPLVHYLQTGMARRYSPHILFDPHWYLQQREKLIALDPPAGDNLLADYLETGVRHRLSPSRLFDVEYYLGQTEVPDGEDCVHHYMVGSHKDRVSPSPTLDAQFYARQAPEALQMKSPFHHLFRTPMEARKRPLAVFDPNFCLAAYADIADQKICPIVHFVGFGARENRHPNRIHSDIYSAAHIVRNPLDLAQPNFGYLRANGHKRMRILFTSHEASRSGAPAIILSLIRGFAEHDNAECITIVDSGGELLPEFKRHSHVMVMSRSVREVGPAAEVHDRDIDELFGLLGDNLPVVALVNAAESRHLGDRLARRGIPVIFFVHEAPSYYPPEQFDIIYRAAKRVVFPSAYIDDNARAHCPYPDGLAVVRGQGLLWPGFGEHDRGQARRKVFQELGLGNDAALVIGCGSVDFRKGADMFMSAAAMLDRRLKDKPGHRPVFFCWVGDGPDIDNMRKEIDRSKLHHVIQFVGSRADVERYFVAGDVFLLTSRIDPYPCVVHEAMAAGMPVIGFDGGGGAPELFGTHAGVAVPSGDVGAMVEAAERLIFDDARRTEMSQAARRIIAERGSNEAYFCDIRAIASEVAGLDLEKALGPRPRRTGKKVFCLAPDWGVSGVNSFAESLVNGLNARGFAAEIVFTRGRFTHWERDNEGRASLPDAPYSRLEPDANTAAAVWRELQRFVKEQAPCVIILNYDYVASAITPILNSNVGVIGVLHSDDAEHYEHAYRLGKYWNRLVAVSNHIAQHVVELNPSFEARLTTLRYGITALPDLDVAGKAPGDADAIELVYTGRFENFQKGIRRYVMLADQLARQGVKARLVMCGTGSEFAAVKAAMGGHIRAGRVELTGRIAVSQVRDILKRSHAFVLLSDFEGLPVSMLEAMDAGCVPIVYDMTSGIPEVVRSGHNGIIVPHGDLAGIVEAVAGLKADRDSWCRMASAARQSVRDLKRTQDDMSEAYAAAIEEVFAEIESGQYRRPPSLAHRAQVDGVLPPPAMYDPMEQLKI